VIFFLLPLRCVVCFDYFLTINRYKPNPKVYLGAAKKLGLQPEECGMVAAHLKDLEAARACGFHTVYIERAREEAWEEDKVAQTKKDGWVDVWVTKDENGFITAAERLGQAARK